MDEILAKITQSARLCAGKNLIVGISGIDGSGKSTLADELVRRLTEQGVTATSVHLDDFLNPKTIRHENTDQIDGYFDDNFDYDSLINSVIGPARAHSRVQSQHPVLDLETDRVSTRDFMFDGPGVLVVEGVFLFRQELRGYFDLKVWLDIGFDDALARILTRSRDRRYGDADAIRSRYENRFFPAQRFHLDRDAPAEAADIVIAASQSVR